MDQCICVTGNRLIRQGSQAVGVSRLALWPFVVRHSSSPHISSTSFPQTGLAPLKIICLRSSNFLSSGSPCRVQQDKHVSRCRCPLATEQHPRLSVRTNLFNAQTGEEGPFQSCNLLLTFSILFQNVLNPAVTRAPSPRHH